jgi:hypothetical protein
MNLTNFAINEAAMSYVSAISWKAESGKTWMCPSREDIWRNEMKWNFERFTHEHSGRLTIRGAQWSSQWNVYYLLNTVKPNECYLAKRVYLYIFYHPFCKHQIVKISTSRRLQNSQNRQISCFFVPIITFLMHLHTKIGVKRWIRPLKVHSVV